MDDTGTTPANWSWREFRGLTAKNCNLLKELNKFPNAVLVTGCQRSGTTMLSRIITESEGMVNYRFGSDDELDAALILSGLMVHQPQGRYCFQTTYIDNCYGEYFDHIQGLFKIIWVLRNPYSVVYSMMYNWRQAALENTFRSCAPQLLTKFQKWKYTLLGVNGFSKVEQASLLFKYKMSQFLELNARFGPDRIMAVDYEDLVLNSESTLHVIYSFIDLEYQSDYSKKIHRKSLQKASHLSEPEIATIKLLAEPAYLEAKKMAITPGISSIASE